ncbi:MAG TPA: SAM-dependent methyltransferase [Burkholderiales bacterium]|nr:SAM-dependent methyltransferase [Burkholderiales bacterium]
MSDGARGTLYLIPVALGGDNALALVAPDTIDTTRRLRTFIAENAKSARAFLKAIAHPGPLQELKIHTLDEHTRNIAPLLKLLLSGEDCGLMSEAGCPAVADPGSALVRRAHEAGVRVVPLVGPSSILLALMASGMNGQRFAFHGYLPVERTERARKLKELEAQASDETQIFIETPYRNEALLSALLQHCRDDTLLCIAADLTLPGGFVAAQTIAEWKKKPPIIDRRPAVFLLSRAST